MLINFVDLKEEGALCVSPCDKLLTIEHMLLTCSHFIETRKQYFMTRSQRILFKDVKLYV